MPSRHHNHSSHTQPLSVGNQGEALVAAYLEQAGWQILALGWRCRWGELDVVARKAMALTFVEVKTRQALNWDQDGLLAVDHRKQGKLIRAAKAFLSQFPALEALNCQFDVALVRYSPSSNEVALMDYISGAFELS